MTTTLPTLTGSTKQIAWAETLREQFDRDIEGYMASKTRGVPVAKAETFRSALTPILRRIALAQTSADWWINNRIVDEAGKGGAGWAYAAQKLMTAADRDELRARAAA